MSLHSKIATFFDAAKDLVQEIASRIEQDPVPAQATEPDDQRTAYQKIINALLDYSRGNHGSIYEGAEIIEIDLQPDDPMIVTITPKKRSVLLGAYCWNLPMQYALLSVRPSFDPFGGSLEDRVCPGSDGFDVAYFNTDCPTRPCPFEFGIAEPGQPITCVFKRLVAEPERLKIDVYAKPLPAEPNTVSATH